VVGQVHIRQVRIRQPRVRALRWVVAAVLAAIAALAPASPASADTVRAQQWHLIALQVAEAQKITTGNGVVVAVVDTGVQADHPDLAGQVLDGVRIHADRDDKGKVDTVGHGTGVAGLIAAKGGGPSHALGIAPGVKILPVAVALGGPGGFDDIPLGIRWAVDHGAKVINLSAATNRTTPQETDAVRYALAHDVVLVAASGNVEQGQASVATPASVPGVIAVSATGHSGEFWTGSAQGPEVALCAPGVDIVTLANHQATGGPGGYVKVPGGTSASAPLVAGAAALVRAKFPTLSAPEVINRLIATADDAGPTGRDPQYGFGRLNIVKALTADVPSVHANPLGEPSAASSATGAAPAGGAKLTSVLIAAGIGAVVVLLGLVLAIVLVVTRSRRRRSHP
jgi:membrane-anchored mycosin MYCP